MPPVWRWPGTLDGKRIVYSEPVGQAIEIFVVDQDGSNKKQLTHLGGANHAASGIRTASSWHSYTAINKMLIC